MQVRALSIVYPAVHNIIAGSKRCEIRSWPPPELPLLNLALVENQVYLRQDGQEDAAGYIRALVDITGVHKWSEEEATGQGKDWLPGYFCWELANIRPVEPDIPCVAKRGIYTLDIAAESQLAPASR